MQDISNVESGFKTEEIALLLSAENFLTTEVHWLYSYTLDCKACISIQDTFRGDHSGVLSAVLCLQSAVYRLIKLGSAYLQAHLLAFLGRQLY